MRLIIGSVLLTMFIASLSFGAAGDKSKTVMQTKFNTFSASKQAQFNVRPTYGTYSANSTVCWKSSGVIGYCRAVTAETGVCDCQ